MCASTSKFICPLSCDVRYFLRSQESPVGCKPLKEVYERLGRPPTEFSVGWSAAEAAAVTGENAARAAIATHAKATAPSVPKTNYRKSTVQPDRDGTYRLLAAL